MKNGSSINRFNRSRVTHGYSNKKIKSKKFYLYGIHTVREALKNPERTKYRLFITPNAGQRLERDIKEVADDLEIWETSSHKLASLLGREVVHQGVALECGPLALKGFEDLQPGVMTVVLDQVSDPHNVGAIMRSCVAMGVGALIFSYRGSAPQSAILAKSASGALDLLDLIAVRNLSKTIDSLNKQSYQTIGLDSAGPDILENSIDPSRPVALVLGAEGKGLRHKTQEACSKLARLDMPGKIRSLNVSNAAALALYITCSGKYR